MSEQRCKFLPGQHVSTYCRQFEKELSTSLKILMSANALNKYKCIYEMLLALSLPLLCKRKQSQKQYKLPILL